MPARSAASTPIVYEYPRAGIWLDLVTRYEDGTSVTFSTSPRGGTLDPRPGCEKVNEPGGEPGSLWKRFIAERPDRPRAEHTAENFVALFEKAYADEIDWRNSRGGPTREEIRRVAAQSGKQPSEEVVAATQERLAARARENLRTGLIDRFARQGTVSGDAWDPERVTVVHDGLSFAQVRAFFSGAGPAAPAGDLSQLPAREAFRRLNECLAADRRFSVLGRVSGPVEADLYAPPA